MSEFVCLECGYNFEAETEKSCPYCAGQRVEKKSSAEELVENSL